MRRIHTGLKSGFYPLNPLNPRSKRTVPACGTELANSFLLFRRADKRQLQGQIKPAFLHFDIAEHSLLREIG